MGKSKKDNVKVYSVVGRAKDGAQIGGAIGGGHGAVIGGIGGAIVGGIEEAVDAAKGKKKSWKQRLIG